MIKAAAADVTLVLIAGPSGSGKSTLAKRVAEALPNNSTSHLLHQDGYFINSYLPYSQRRDASFEDGSGIDWGSLQKDMESFAKRDSNASTLVIEGHMLGAASGMFLNAFDQQASVLIVLIRCTEDTCKRRRLNRRERSKEEFDELSSYYDKYVWPSFVQFGVPAMNSLQSCGRNNNAGRNIDILDLTGENDDSLEPNVKKILENIQKITNNRPPKQKEEITEEWASTNLQGFAKHHKLTVRYDLRQDASFELECVESLTPLDMVHLSQGAHDATGSSIWMGAYYLIEALASNVTCNSQFEDIDLSLRGCFQGKRLLELGCGTGVAGLSLLLAARSWEDKPSHICFTDNDDPVLALCQCNYEHNKHLKNDASCSFALLEWGSTLEGEGAFETVLATDVIYDIACLQPLISTTVQSLQPLGIFVLAHVPRSCLPEPQSAEPNNDDRNYHTALEDYIVKSAEERGLRLLGMIRPSDIRRSDRNLDDLNETTLSEMEEAGAAILLFQKEASTVASHDSNNDDG